ncbi:MAG: DUF951 domain-containing protein [Anaerolineae bacterium]|nr:DUF951 domain-containing protein [Anaerolineae bacterium]
MPMELRIGDIVRLRKVHPCGGYEWEVVRIGADIGLRCLTCGRRILTPRSKIEKRIKSVRPRDEDAAAQRGA